MFLITSIFRFIVLVLTDLSIIPSIQFLKKSNRHFILFIATFQFMSKTFFNFCEAFQIKVFLDEGIGFFGFLLAYSLWSFLPSGIRKGTRRFDGA